MGSWYCLIPLSSAINGHINDKESSLLRMPLKSVLNSPI